MSLAVAPPTVDPLTQPRRLWTGEEFDRLVADGLIREGSRAFLWAGEIIEPMAEDQPHINAVFSLFRLLLARFPAESWTVNINQPVDLGAGYRPQPDLVVLRGDRSRFEVPGSRPRPADVALLAEISDSTYSDDCGPFLRRYAEAAIAQYWIVNVRARRIEVYSCPDPVAYGYRTRVDFALDEAVPIDVMAEEAGEVFEAVPVLDVLRNSSRQDRQGGI